jgi:hypothetical protein
MSRAFYGRFFRFRDRHYFVVGVSSAAGCLLLVIVYKGFIDVGLKPANTPFRGLSFLWMRYMVPENQAAKNGEGR